MKEIIIIVSFSNINEDSRLKRQIKSLKIRYKLICFGYGEYLDQDIKFIKLNQFKSFKKSIWTMFNFLLSRYEKFTYLKFSYEQILKEIQKYNVRAFILNDCYSWPLMKYISPNNCIVDAHEYTPEEFNENFFWNFFIKRYKLWCSDFVSKAKAHFCVEKNLCKKWSIYSQRDFKLLRNYSFYYHSTSQVKEINYPLKIVHHGIANKSRRIENMIRSILYCGSNYEGYFYLKVRDSSIINTYKRIIQNNKVFLLDPIKEENLISVCSNYDLAILSIYPSNTNYKYCLPNKLFQFIQSRLPIISGPTPSIIEIINDYKIGIIADSFSPKDLAKAILSIEKKDILEMKSNCNLAAKNLCWENESKYLLKKLKEL